MGSQRGFVLLIGLLLGVVILMAALAYYSGFLEQGLLKIPALGEEEDGQSQIIIGEAVSYEITNIRSGEAKRGTFGLTTLDVFDYRIRVVETDYQTYAKLSVENVSDGIFQFVELGEGEEKKIGNIKIKIREFIKISCPPGLECEE